MPGGLDGPAAAPLWHASGGLQPRGLHASDGLHASGGAFCRAFNVVGLLTGTAGDADASESGGEASRACCAATSASSAALIATATPLLSPAAGSGKSGLLLPERRLLHGEIGERGFWPGGRTGESCGIGLSLGGELVASMSATRTRPALDIDEENAQNGRGRPRAA